MLLCLPVTVAAQGRVTISGFVKELGSQEQLPGDLNAKLNTTSDKKTNYT
jgi:hypothetical protein